MTNATMEPNLFPRGYLHLMQVVMLLLVIGEVAVIRAVQADSPLEVLDRHPSAVIGDVLAIPVRVEEGRWNSRLPEQVELLFDDGVHRGALVTWIGPPPADARSPITPSWTSPAMPIRVIEAPPSGSARLNARGVLLCPLPVGYSGRIQFEEIVIEPRWLVAAPPLKGDRLKEMSGAGWPPLDDPGAWWRWALLAEKEGRIPPEPVGDVRSKLLARHIGGLWRAGLARLRWKSSGTAAELRDLLVARCTTDTGHLIAVWITDPTELRSILELMLDTGRDDMVVVRSILFFLDARFPVLVWTTIETGLRVRVALANPTDGEQVIRLQWIEGDPVPSAAVVPPGRVIEIDVDRPREVTIAPSVLQARPKPNELAFFSGRHQHRLRLRPDRLEARPPGVQLGPFLAPMALRGAWSGVAIPTPLSWGTSATLRKHDERWEVFLECFADAQVPVEWDAIEIFLGPPGAPLRVIQVDSDGSLHFEPGGGRLRGARATSQRHADRWRAVVSLDPELVASAAMPGRPGTLQIGLWRILDGRPLSIAGGAVPPWDSLPPAFFVDLTTWGDIEPSARSGGSSDDALLYSDP